VKAFGGVLNGLDGNFGFAEKGDQKMNARTNQFWRFPFREESGDLAIGSSGEVVPRSAVAAPCPMIFYFTRSPDDPITRFLTSSA
jgi:hypothetical protein